MTWAQTLDDVQSETAARAASLWGDTVLERVGVSANLVYRLASGNYLRLIHSSLRDLESVAAGVDWARWLEALPTVELLTCHGDFRPANAVWNGANVWIIDFDEPVMAWPEYDVARAMSRDVDGPFPNLSTHLEVFKRGYESHHSLNLERLQSFTQLHALLSLSWSLGDNSWDWSHDLRRLALKGIQF